MYQRWCYTYIHTCIQVLFHFFVVSLTHSCSSLFAYLSVLNELYLFIGTDSFICLFLLWPACICVSIYCEVCAREMASSSSSFFFGCWPGPWVCMRCVTGIYGFQISGPCEETRLDLKPNPLPQDTLFAFHSSDFGPCLQTRMWFGRPQERCQASSYEEP